MSIFSNGNYQQVGGQGKVRSYRKNKDGKGGWDVGDQIAGKLISIGKDKFGKPSYTIQVQDVDFKNKADQPSVGELFTINSTGGIEYKLEQIGGVSVGQVFGIEYNGEVTIEKGTRKGSKSHDIDVFVMADTSVPAKPQVKEEQASDLDLI